jgi:peptide-methionine (S)-S-oxide reductase
VIFFHDEAQRAAAEASKARIQKTLGRQPIVVAITAAGPFYRAEEYHQDYYKKNSAQYRFYRFGCGRDRRLEEIWAKTG